MILNATAWQAFCADYATLRIGAGEQDRTAYWEYFFQCYAAFRHMQPPQVRAPILLPVWASFFSCFASVHSAHRQQGKAVDVWQLAQIGRDELRNCSILAWLLNCHGSHGQGAAFLKKFLLRTQCWQDSMESECIDSYRVTVEESYDEYEPGSDKQRSRVDIVLESPTFLLLIEAKVKSGETDNQLERYLRIGRVLAGDRPWLLVYLTLDGRPPRDGDLRDKVVCVRWRDLGREFLRYVDSMPVASHGTVVIRQFCQHIINL